MKPFKINTEEEKISSVSRTIRMKAETFDRINELNLKTGVSFNKIVNQCIEYALENYTSSEMMRRIAPSATNKHFHFPADIEHIRTDTVQ